MEKIQNDNLCIKLTTLASRLNFFANKNCQKDPGPRSIFSVWKANAQHFAFASFKQKSERHVQKGRSNEMPVFVSRARFGLVFKLVVNKVFVYCGTATKTFLIEQCLFFSLVQMSGSCECYTWERSIYKKAIFVEVTESSPVSEAYRKKKRNLSEGTKFRSDLKNSLIVEPVWKSSSLNDYLWTKTTFNEATSHSLAKTASTFRLYCRTNPRETVRIHLKVVFDRT